MRARPLLLGASVALAGLCTWAAFLLGADGERDAAQRQRDSVVGNSGAPAPDALPASEGEGGAGAGAAPLEVESVERSAEIVLSDVDTLRSVRGVVLDARSREPVPGITLTFLSRRPRTIAVVTDEKGRFHTGAELACGAVSVQHAPQEADLRFAARWTLEPNQFVLPPRQKDEPADAAREIVLLAHDPERVLEVAIRLPDGQPAQGAAVSLTLGDHAENGTFVPLERDFEEADAAGRVRFPLFGDDVYGRTLQVEAEHGGTLASDVLTIDPPLVLRPLALALHPGGVVRVRTRNDEGRPVAGVSLYLSTHEDARSARGWHGATDAADEGLFTALRAGCYTVSALDPRTGERIERTLDLARSEQEVVDLKLSVAGLRLGLQGQVQDEYGYPLPGVELSIVHGDGATSAVASGDKGQFEFWARPEPALLLRIGGGLADDRFEPAETEVPFGTREIVLRRAASLPERTLAFEVLERSSGEPLRSARIALYVGDPEHADARELAVFDAPRGVVQAVFKLRPGLGYTVEAPGHVRVVGRIADLLRRDPARVEVRFPLDPGFERRLVVRDRASGRPLARVRVMQGDRILATSGADGTVELALAAWPAALRFEAAGYQLLAWDPLHAPFPTDSVWLEALR
ncbi:MAG: hypothetical protein IPJ77_16920 [Planctomycetes bacterium]|nr:hypothetical protein [Planctomycetota bacterium]